jgi:hypothetical protein
MGNAQPVPLLTLTRMRPAITAFLEGFLNRISVLNMNSTFSDLAGCLN